MYAIADRCNRYDMVDCFKPQTLVTFQPPKNLNMADYHTYLVVDHVMNDVTLNLTGHVTKTALSSFAYGGNADVWKGLWLDKSSGITIEAST